MFTRDDGKIPKESPTTCYSADTIQVKLALALETADGRAKPSRTAIGRRADAQNEVVNGVEKVGVRHISEPC